MGGGVSEDEISKGKQLVKTPSSPNIFNKAMHVALLLSLLWLIILFSTDNKLLLAEHYFLQGIKYLTNFTIYKTIILSFSNSKPILDTFISLLYLIFTALFINLYFATCRNKYIYLNEAAFKNRDSFSGVMATHIYGKLLPTIYPHFEYSKYKSGLPVKQFNEFVFEQLKNEGTKAYFTFFSLAAFVILPIFVIYLTDVKTPRLVDIRLISVLMVYSQVKVIFEVILILKEFFNKDK